MTRTAYIIFIAAAAAIAVAVVLLVWRPFDSRPAIVDGAPGTWQEQTAADPLRLTLSAAGDDGGVPMYSIAFQRPEAQTYSGRLEGDTIVVLSPDAQDTVWVITYDEGADALLVARADGTQRHILRRVPR